MEIQTEVIFFPIRKKISLLGYIFILISLQLIICTDFHTIVAAQDTSVYSLSGTYSCENCCKTSALLYWRSLFTFQGKVPEEMVKEGKSVIFFLCFLFCLKTKENSKTYPKSHTRKNFVIK